MQATKKKIVLDCERMKYPHTGLYHFCFELGKEIISQSSAVGMDISIYTAKSCQEKFIGHSKFIDQSPLHKFILPSLHGFQLWHATHQSTEYYPNHENIKILLTIHDINFIHEKAKSTLKQQREIEKLQKKIDRSDQVVAISNFVKDDLLQHFKIAEDKIKVIYNGCNIQGSRPVQVHLIPLKQAFIFTIGTIVAKKNFHVLPALLVGNDFQLVIAGITQKNGYQQQIIAEAEKLGVVDRLVFTGAISEAEKFWYYQQCRAFVFPSLMEGFGLPVVEAMAFGKPIFLSRKTSLPEIGGDVVQYFNSFDAAHMQETLMNGLKIYDEDANLKVRIIERSKLFSWQTSAKEYVEIYRQVLAQ